MVALFAQDDRLSQVTLMDDESPGNRLGPSLREMRLCSASDGVRMATTNIITNIVYGDPRYPEPQDGTRIGMLDVPVVSSSSLASKHHA